MVPHKGGSYFNTLMEGISKKPWCGDIPHTSNPIYLPFYLSFIYPSICCIYIYMYIYLYIYLYIYIFIYIYIYIYIYIKIFIYFNLETSEKRFQNQEIARYTLLLFQYGTGVLYSETKMIIVLIIYLVTFYISGVICQIKVYCRD